ncbi:hypothetical protein BHC24_07750 [Oenococcus oeni]|uniref:hypothetical protein n=1 Tax=Oenococcus oeni TaxID=1247 RepID=UPI000D14D26B|nr:hypothetical protein [Oenococcus oeni]PST70438.1 hypothetical protein BHC24_07750 [Oenococcus oeni]
MFKRLKVIFAFKQLLIVLLSIAMLIGVACNLVYPFENTSSLILLPIVFIGPLLVFFLYRYLKKLPPFLLKRIILIAFLIMVLVQIYVFSAMPATIYHDPFRVIQEAEQVSTGDIDWTSDYFWRYPNNVPLTALVGFWFKLTNLLGLTPNLAIHILSLLFLDSMIIILLMTAKKITGNLALPFICQLFFLLSPYAYTYNLQVFYSDLPIYFSISALLLIVLKWQKADFKSKKWRFLSLVLLFLICLFAQIIKPNFLIVALAAFITILAAWLAKKKMIKVITIPLITIILAVLIAFPATKVLDSSINFKNNEQYELPITHWIYMGLNLKRDGSYSGRDTKSAVKRVNINAREKADIKGISRRLKKAGIFNLIKLWTSKVAILLNVSKYNHAYTGGYVSAPAWFQKGQAWWSATASLVLRLAFITIYSLALISLYRLFKVKEVNYLLLFSLLIAVGYVAFHTFLWEVEGRYGQAITPILFLLIANTFSKAAIAEKKTKRDWKIPLFILAFLSLGGIYLKANARLINSRGIATIAQRSQLSNQYNPHVTWLAAHSSVTQNVSIAATNDYFSILKVKGSRAVATLTNRTTKQTFNINAGHTKYSILNQLKPGEYQIKVTNPTDDQQAIWLVKTHNYQLGQESATTPEPTWGKRSFVYMFSQNRVHDDQGTFRIVKIKKPYK